VKAAAAAAAAAWGRRLGQGRAAGRSSSSAPRRSLIANLRRGRGRVSAPPQALGAGARAASDAHPEMRRAGRRRRRGTRRRASRRRAGGQPRRRRCVEALLVIAGDGRPGRPAPRLLLASGEWPSPAEAAACRQHRAAPGALGRHRHPLAAADSGWLSVPVHARAPPQEAAETDHARRLLAAEQVSEGGGSYRGAGPATAPPPPPSPQCPGACRPSGRPPRRLNQRR
jgi:hypothetical protein